MATPAWLVYVLRSACGRRTYVGVTRDLSRRLAQHNGLRPGGARTTRAHRPWTVAACFGPFPDRAGAQRVEARLRRLRGAARLTAPDLPRLPGTD